jgi:hypothetical protein
LLACAVVIVVGGCGSGESSSTSTATSATSSTPPPTTGLSTTVSVPSTTVEVPTTPATTPASAVTTTLVCPVLSDTDVKSDGFPGKLSGLVGADIRTGADSCHERVVLELQGTGDFPGWWVRYQPPPLIDDPRGEPVDVNGAAFIVITVESWMTNMEGDGYHGPTRITPTNVSHIEELVMLGDCESVTTWAIGVDQQRPFAVTTLASPPRLVLDIATS